MEAGDVYEGYEDRAASRLTNKVRGHLARSSYTSTSPFVHKRCRVLNRRAPLRRARLLALLGVVSFVAGAIWLLLLPAVCVTTGETKVRGRYVSDKSLLPVGLGFHREFVQDDARWAHTFQRSLQNAQRTLESSGAPTRRAASFVQNALADAGLAARVRTALAADGSEVTAVVATLAARGGDGKEGIVLVASYGDALHDDTHASPLAVLVALVRRLAAHGHAKWLSKDVTLLLLPALGAETCTALCAAHTRWEQSGTCAAGAAAGSNTSASAAQCDGTAPIACSPLCAGLAASRWTAQWMSGAPGAGDGRALLPVERSLIRAALVIEPRALGPSLRDDLAAATARRPHDGSGRMAALRAWYEAAARRARTTRAELERLTRAHDALSGRVRHDDVALVAPGRNGRLPNLDLLNAMRQVLNRRGGRVRHARWQREDWAAAGAAQLCALLHLPAHRYRPYAERLANTVRFAVELLHAPGPHLAPHSALLDLEIDAFTLAPLASMDGDDDGGVGGSGATETTDVATSEAVEAALARDPDNVLWEAVLEEEAMRLADTAESFVRMISNMHEKLNRSFYMYLLPSASTFVSIDEYIWLLALLTMPWLALGAIARYTQAPLRAAQTTADADAAAVGATAAQVVAMVVVAAVGGGAALHLARTLSSPRTWLASAALLPLALNVAGAALGLVGGSRTASGPARSAGGAAGWVLLLVALWLAHAALGMLHYVLAVCSALILVPITAVAFALDRGGYCSRPGALLLLCLQPAVGVAMCGAALAAANGGHHALSDFVAAVLTRFRDEQSMLIHVACGHVAALTATLWLARQA